MHLLGVVIGREILGHILLIEKELLSKQVDLAEAKAESIKSQKDMEKVYLDAMAAMREYRGESEADDDED